MMFIPLHVVVLNHSWRNKRIFVMRFGDVLLYLQYQQNKNTMCEIIGRKKEIAELRRYYNSGRAEFVAVYGRRRVGKTFLVDEVFHDNMVFHHTGLSPYDRHRKTSLKSQLQNFYFSLLRHGMENAQPPRSWMEAFFMLERFLETSDNGTRQVVFIDELPWIDTVRSGFLTALEAFWNGWGNTRHNLLLVVCGSATSWMLDNIINNKGGLYGRLTGEMKLSPFTLKECDEFFKCRGIKMSKYNVLQAYMALGGIPFYLNMFNAAYSLPQNIDSLFFERNAKLGDEFDRLFNSIFDNADDCMEIVRLLGTRHSGYTRKEIVQKTGLSSNGDLTKMLKALVGSDFVVKYVPFGASSRDEHYKLIDSFCWFWLHFKESKRITQPDYWQCHVKESEISAWRGIAFEEVCLRHISQIKNALNIGGVSTNESAYTVRDGEQGGMQIDLLIERADDVVNVCEMKFYRMPFAVTKSYAQTLAARLQYLEEKYPSLTFHLTYIGSTELVHNEYSDIFTSVVTADELFV